MLEWGPRMLSSPGNTSPIFYDYLLQDVFIRCLFVCLSICMCAISRKNYWSDHCEYFTTDVSANKKDSERVTGQLWKLPASVSRCRNFLRIFQKMGHPPIFPVWLTWTI